MRSEVDVPYSIADLRRRAARETGPFDVDEFGDHRLNPEARDGMLSAKLRDAAVLMPVVDRPGEPTVILTQRNANLRNHSGQIAFPGGRIDPGDRSPEDAALRETEEEIGLPRSKIEVIGRLPDYVSGSGYRIAPVLAVVEPAFTLRLNPDEVDSAFEVPLAFLMDEANHRRQSRVWNDRERFFYEMPFGERYIWGVTAGIIRTLYERLYA